MAFHQDSAMHHIFQSPNNSYHRFSNTITDPVRVVLSLTTIIRMSQQLISSHHHNRNTCAISAVLSGKQRPSFTQTDTPSFPKAPNYIPRGFPNEVKALHHNHHTPHTSILSSIAVHHTIPPIQYTARITHTQHQFTQQPPKDSFRILTIDSQRYLDNPSQS